MARRVPRQARLLGVRVSAPSLAHELLDEIERVVAKRERWKAYARTAPPDVWCGLGINMMSEEIDRAKRALLDDDAIDSLVAIHRLKSYDNQD